MSYDFTVIGLFKYFIFLSLYLIFASRPVSAQYDWTIESFNSQINLLSSGKVQITETIIVNFEIQKHGIFRDIPYIYTAEDGTKTYTKIEVQNITRNNADEKYKVSKQGDYIDIKIGDPNKTITGNQTYTIDYLASGVLRSFDAYDELYWNVTGNYWEIPIAKSSATVNLPHPAIEKTACFIGSLGSTENCAITSTGSTATFVNSRPLEAGEGMTVAAAYKKGLVPILTVEPPESFGDQLLKPQTLVLFLITLAGGAGTIFYLWYTRGRDFWFKRKDLFDPNAKEETKPISAHETIVVEYSPPENLRPAELGTLVDQRADTLDVTATIIDLAVRGYLTISEKPKKWLFGKTDYILTKTKKETRDLLPYEKYLYDEIFTIDTVSISSLKKTFYDELAEVKKKLYEQVVSKKLFTRNPDTTRNIYLALGIFLAIGGIILTFVGIGNQIALVAAFSFPLFLNSVLLIIFSRFMPARTGYGRELYRRVKGYELFIAKAEAHRQKFFENKNLFNEVLPYAITFGLVEKFATAMKDIGLKPSQATTGWYVGTHKFAFDSFASSINDFSGSVTKSIAATPSKGGGFSGGGSSGGGFGGGGGGSW